MASTPAENDHISYRAAATELQLPEAGGELSTDRRQKREVGRSLATRYRIPIVIEPYAEGGYGVRSPLLPELITDGETIDEAVTNAEDAARCVLELYEDLGKELPEELLIANRGKPITLDLLAESA